MLVKQNLQVLHKIIKRARDTPVVQLKDDISLPEQNNFISEISSDATMTIHDWSKTTNLSRVKKILF